MLKLAVAGPAREAIDVRRPIEWNLPRIAEALRKPVWEVTVTMLKRPRHKGFVEQIRKVGARIHLIPDGDVMGAIEPCLESSKIDLLYGVGKSTEAVLAAAALRCLGGEIQCQWWFDPESPEAPQQEELLRRNGLSSEEVYTVPDLAEGNVCFAATAVTPTRIMEGVIPTPDGAQTCSIAARSKTGTVRLIRTLHNFRTHQKVPTPVY